ncbi:MAG TPA: tRNA (adenosine(37)-N6)-threonylcarbamoyltransferase complex dimerization subunit type 1 TsaB [Crenotrichaceae bacterium]|nr:tRNA (adenosine(37)-N6)-threonylcarbamoyltransferase complex dimerization subunit type 1 TsaB [Crenotrichaceae bacterium]
MKILALETATEACSAALLIDSEVDERFQITPREHSQFILPMVDELMHQAGMSVSQLDAIAFGRGPGSFTGVRLAAAVTQGIAFAADLPVLPVSTLAAMAEDAFRKNTVDCVFTAIDARMKEIYWAVFTRQNTVLVENQKESVLAPECVEFIGNDKGIGVGSGWTTYHHILTEKLSSNLTGITSDCFPHAASVARLGAKLLQADGAVLSQQAIPLYLRNNVTHRSGRQ